MYRVLGRIGQIEDQRPYMEKSESKKDGKSV